jgi:hypothetical protein
MQIIDEKDSSLADLRGRTGRITYVAIRREAP